MFKFYQGYFHMTLGVCAVIMVILIIRPLIKRFSNRIMCLLWAVVLIRLLCPYTIQRPAFLASAPQIDAQIRENAPEQTDREERLMLSGKDRSVGISYDNINYLPDNRKESSDNDIAENDRKETEQKEAAREEVPGNKRSADAADMTGSVREEYDITQLIVNEADRTKPTDTKSERTGAKEWSTIDEKTADFVGNGAFLQKNDAEKQSFDIRKQYSNLSAKWKESKAIRVAKEWLGSKAGRRAVTGCGSLWIVGMMWFIGFGAIKYFMIARKLKESVALGMWKNYQVRTSDIAGVPMSFGIIHRRIYVPFSFGEDDECSLSMNRQHEMVLRHEEMHLAHYDTLWKVVAYLGLAVHWWNPLVWYAIRCMNQDLEMACDEKVLEAIGEDKKREYAVTLLEFAAYQSGISLMAAFGESHSERRIKNVIRYKKAPVWLTTILIGVVMMLGGCLVTTTAKSDDKEEKESSSQSDMNNDSVSGEDNGSGQQMQPGSVDDAELVVDHGEATMQLRIGEKYYPLGFDVNRSTYGTHELHSGDYDGDGSLEYAVFDANCNGGEGHLYVIEIDGDLAKVSEFDGEDLCWQIKDTDDMKLISTQSQSFHVDWHFLQTPTARDDFFKEGVFPVDAVLWSYEGDHAGDITGKLRYLEDGSFTFENAGFTVREGYLKQKVLDTFSAQELQKVTKKLSADDVYDFSPEETGFDDIRVIAKASGDDACLYGIYAKDGGATVLRVGEQVYPTGINGWTDCQNSHLVRVNRSYTLDDRETYVLIWQDAADADTMVSYFGVEKGTIWIPRFRSGILIAESPRKGCELYNISVDRVGDMTLLRRGDEWFQADRETQSNLDWYKLTTDAGIEFYDQDRMGCNELWTNAYYCSADNSSEYHFCSPLILNHKKLGVIEQTTEDTMRIIWYEPERKPNESEYEYFSNGEIYSWSEWREWRDVCYKKNRYAADGTFESSEIGYVDYDEGKFSFMSPVETNLVLRETYDLGVLENGEHMYCEYFESAYSWESVYCIMKNQKIVLRFEEIDKGEGSVRLEDIDDDGQKELIIIHGRWGANYDPVDYRVFKEQEDGQWRMLDCPRSLPIGMRMDANGKDGIVFCNGLDKTIIVDTKEQYRLLKENGREELAEYFKNACDYSIANEGAVCTDVGGPEPFEVEIDSYEGKTCLKAEFRLRTIDGAKFDVIGISTVYFNYDEQGAIRILDLMYEPVYSYR